jgi:hypothetical protein
MNSFIVMYLSFHINFVTQELNSVINFQPTPIVTRRYQGTQPGETGYRHDKNI